MKYMVSLYNASEEHSHFLHILSKRFSSAEARCLLLEGNIRFTSARKHEAPQGWETEIELSTCVIECGNCGKLMALDEFSRLEEWEINELKELAEWFFPPNETKAPSCSRSFWLNSLPYGEHRFCSHCGHLARVAPAKRWITVAATAKKTEVCLPVNAQAESFSRRLEHSSKVVSEEVRIVFDHVSGRTQYETVCSGQVQNRRDITENCRFHLPGFAIEEHLESNRDLQQVLAKIFVRRHESPFPFPYLAEELDLVTLILLNRFCGFPRSFYNSIPFEQQSPHIHNSFFSAAEKLRYYPAVKDLYAELNLPKGKALQKCIFENPALLFYKAEIERIPFQNPDVLRSILCSRWVFLFLSEIHVTPQICFFLWDMVQAKGEAKAWRAIESASRFLPGIWARYAQLPASKKNDPKLFNGSLENICDRLYSYYEVKFHAPLRLPHEILQLECRIGEYRFVVLASRIDFENAASNLYNCLRSYWRRERDTFVIGIMHHGRYVGAVEITVRYSEKQILQAEGRFNEPIEQDKELGEIYRYWKMMNGLEESYDDDD